MCRYLHTWNLPCDFFKHTVVDGFSFYTIRCFRRSLQTKVYHIERLAKYGYSEVMDEQGRHLFCSSCCYTWRPKNDQKRSFDPN